ncbi:MAG: sel1 repeat family protein [Cyanobacteria bacterium REEB67]|nr:sel1 repeat family protein [Cyanobacteria bacterium REEB67]
MSDHEKLDRLLAAAEHGDIAAMTHAAFILTRGLEAAGAHPALAADLPRALALYEHAAAAGSLIAQYNLGCFYMSSAARNYQSAQHWLERAAQGGDADAQFTLAYMLQRGLSGMPDHAGAYYWYKKAAYNGSGRAQYDLACIYLNGQGVDCDREKAIYWFEQAAQAGISRARAHLLELQ